MALGRTYGAEVGDRGSGDRKVEASCVGEIMLVNSCCVCFGGIGYGYKLLEGLGVDGGADMVSIFLLSYSIGDDKLEGYPMG